METNKSTIVFPYEVGPKEPEPLCLAEINAVTQTRQAYDPDGIDELAQSMLKRDKDHVIIDLKLINAPLIGRFTKDTATAYIDDLNDLFGTSHIVDELTPTQDGRYLIVIAGHRRSLALARAAELAGGTPAELFVRAVVVDDVEFAEAFKDQTIENIHDRPPAQDEAEAIAKYCEFRQRKNADGQRISVAQCARELSLKDAKVRNAIKYAELPVRVKKFVNEGALTFTDGVIINDVQRAYHKREVDRAKLDPDHEDATDHLTETFAIRVINRRARKDVGEKFGAKQFLNMVKGEINNINQSIIHAEGFFEAEEIAATAKAQRAVAVGRLTETLVVLAGIVHENDPDQIDTLIEKLFAMLPDQKIEDELTAQLRSY